MKKNIGIWGPRLLLLAFVIYILLVIRGGEKRKKLELIPTATKPTADWIRRSTIVAGTTATKRARISATKTATKTLKSGPQATKTPKSGTQATKTPKSGTQATKTPKPRSQPIKKPKPQLIKKPKPSKR